MNRILAVAILAALSGCAAENQAATSALKAAGVSDDAAQRAILIGNAVGQLTCATVDGGFVQPVGANVVGATVAAVSQVCAVARPGSVPTALPAGVVPAAVQVTQGALAVLNASKGP